MNKCSMAPALKGVSNKTGNKGLQARFVIGFSRFLKSTSNFRLVDLKMTILN